MLKLSIMLDEDAEKYLAAILSQEHTNTNTLIKELLRDRWSQLQPSKTFLENLLGL